MERQGFAYLLVCPKMTCKTGWMSVYAYVLCQHFRNRMVPRLLGWRRWNLAHVFYGLSDQPSRKHNFEFRPLCCVGQITHPDPVLIGCSDYFVMAWFISDRLFAGGYTAWSKNWGYLLTAHVYKCLNECVWFSLTNVVVKYSLLTYLLTFLY